MWSWLDKKNKPYHNGFMPREKTFVVPIPKVKGRGKLPPPPAIHPNKLKVQDKKACRGHKLYNLPSPLEI